MKKIASLVSLAIAAAGIASGCAVDTADGVPQETVDAAEGAFCTNPQNDNISAMFASLATAMARELNRMQFTNDLEIYRGAYNQEMLRVTALSKQSLCKDGCRNVEAILAFQNPLNPPYIFNNGTQLDPWSFASRLVTGWRAQKTCQDRFWAGDPSACVTEWHYLEQTGSQPLGSICGISGRTLFQFKASKANLYGQKLNPEQPLYNLASIQKMFLWTDQDQNLPVNNNPFMQFQVLSDGVTVQFDPGEGDYPSPPGTVGCGSKLLQFSYTNIAGTCCEVLQTNNNNNTTLLRGTYHAYSVKPDGSGYYKCM